MKNVMADVRPCVGVPIATDFTNDLGSPILVDSTTGDLYVLIGSTVTKAGAAVTTGTWTPADVSGGGLPAFTTLIAASYIKIGKFVFVNMAIQYPVTANGANASIGGLPFTVGSTYGGGTPYTDAAQAIILAPNPATTLMTVVPTFGGGAITNLQLSGKIVIAAISYISA
jgi:hypothetical protein